MATWTTQPKPGTAGNGWEYDQVDIEYDSLLEPITNNTLAYDLIGTTVAWTTINKN